MKFYCPDCGALILAGDMDLAGEVAKCRACNAAFSISSALEKDASRRAAAAPAPQRPILSRPQYMHVEESGGTWRVHWRWLGARHLFMIFFCVAWDAFLIFWYSIAFSEKHVPWIMVVFPVGHLAIGIGLTYSTLAGLLNWTTVEVGPDALIVRHAPLPWRGNRRLAAGDITQVHCERVSKTSKNQQMLSYDVCATLRDGSRVKLVRGLDEAGDAKYLEGEIERRLNIAPRAVAGEYQSQTNGS